MIVLLIMPSFAVMCLLLQTAAQSQLQGRSHDIDSREQMQQQKLASDKTIRLIVPPFNSKNQINFGAVELLQDISKPVKPAQLNVEERCAQGGICVSYDTVYTRSKPERLELNQQRQQQIVQAMNDTWRAYTLDAFGYDNLKPLSQKGSEWFGLGLAIIDTMDTLLLFKMNKEYEQARHWVYTQLSMNQDKDHSNTFELTIRILGGLLSAYSATSDTMFALQAADIGTRLQAAFNTSSYLSIMDINLAKIDAQFPDFTLWSSLSETGSLNLEFWYLQHVTGCPAFSYAQDQMFEHTLLPALNEFNGLLPIHWSSERGKPMSLEAGMGARSDSFYEYLLKYWLLTGKQHSKYKNGYLKAMRATRDRLICPSKSRGFLYLYAINSKGSLSRQMDHLACFLPGTLALGWLHGLNSGSLLSSRAKRGFRGNDMDDLQLARELMRTCYHWYVDSPSGLAPESVELADPYKATPGFAAGGAVAGGGVSSWGRGDYSVHRGENFNLLRPETVESLFVLYYVTKDEMYREWAWSIFLAFKKYAQVSHNGAFTATKKLNMIPPQKQDRMDSFWMSETLKYLYLILEEEATWPLERYVFNTEAHPFPIPSQGMGPKRGELVLPEQIFQVQKWTTRDELLKATDYLSVRLALQRKAYSKTPVAEM